jgi:hypothetical protein
MADEEITFTVQNREHGYAHVRVNGTYTGPATVDDVRKRFYHDYFGGRDAWCRDGRFGAVIHTD